MHVMLLGAGGFIGRYILTELLAAGDEVTATVRSVGSLDQAFPSVRFIEIDLAKSTDKATWHPLVEGVDCLINTAGVLRGPTMQAIHVDMPAAFYAAAAKAGAKRAVLLSAISARPNVETDYARSKLQGEKVLRSSGLDWTILRPSLVYGDGSYGGTSLIRGFAGLPCVVPIPGNGEYAFTPIHARDLARGIVKLCEGAEYAGQTLEPVGPETLELRSILARYRAWLGFGKARVLSIPMPVIRSMGRIGDIFGNGPVSTNSLEQMVAGNAGDSTAYARAIGFPQLSMDEALFARPAQVQDRWHARLFFLPPAIKAVLVLLWIGSAILGLAYGAEATAQLLARLNLPPEWAPAAMILGSAIDLAVAAIVLLDQRARRSTAIQLAVVLGYTAILTVGIPELWLDPLGPLLKNLPILALIFVHGAIGDRR